MAGPNWLERMLRRATSAAGNSLNEWWARELVRAGYKYVFIEVPIEGELPRHGGGFRKTARVPHVDIVFGNSLDDLHWLDSKTRKETGFTRAQRITYPAVNERGGEIVLRDNAKLKRRFWATRILNFADGKGYDLHHTKLKPQSAHVVFQADQAAIEVGDTSIHELLTKRRGKLYPPKPDYPNLDTHGLADQRKTSMRGGSTSSADSSGPDADGWQPRRGGGFTPGGGPGSAGASSKLAMAARRRLAAAASRRFVALSRLLGRFIVKRVIPVAEVLDAVVFVVLLLKGKYKEALRSAPIIQYAFLPADIWLAIDEARKTEALDKAIHDQMPRILGRRLPVIVQSESERIASYYFAKAWGGDFPQPLFVYLSPIIDFVNRKGGRIGEYEYASRLRREPIDWLVQVGRRARSGELQSMVIIDQRPEVVRLRVTYERPLLAPADLLWSYLSVLGDGVVQGWHPDHQTARVNERYSSVMRSIARAIAALKNDAMHGWPARENLTPAEVAGASRARLYRQLAKSLTSTHAVVVGLIRAGQLNPNVVTLSRGSTAAGVLPDLGIAEGLRRVALMLESLGQDPKRVSYLRFEHDSYRNQRYLVWDPYTGWEGELREFLEPLGRRSVNQSASDHEFDVGSMETTGQVVLEPAR